MMQNAQDVLVQQLVQDVMELMEVIEMQHKHVVFAYQQLGILQIRAQVLILNKSYLNLILV